MNAFETNNLGDFLEGQELESWELKDFDDVLPILDLLQHDFESTWNGNGSFLFFTQ